MTVSFPLLKKAVAGLLTAMLAAPLLADTRITLDRNGSGQQLVTYRDADHLRIGTDAQPNWYLTTGGSRFVIMKSPDGKKRFAMNMDEFLARDDAPTAAEVDLEALTATNTGREETVNGITGQVYQVEVGNNSRELVLTDDETIATVTEAVYGAEIRMAQMSGQAIAAQPLASELALAKSLGAPGILRGQIYTLADLEQGDDLPDEHFQLAGDTLVVKDWKEMQDAYH